jgi:hypothetical protein
MNMVHEEYSPVDRLHERCSPDDTVALIQHMGGEGVCGGEIFVGASSPHEKPN